MTLQQEINVSADMAAWVGKEAGRHTSPPVSLSDIRKCAIALYWPETPPRLYWDADYAKKTRFGGIVAPEVFNPFAWSIGIPSGAFLPDAVSSVLKTAGRGLNWVNGGSREEFHAIIRPGDVITSVITLDDVHTRQGDRFPMLFFTKRYVWTNQRGELVKVSRQTSIGVLGAP
jgi:acyl dehydratase